MHRYVSIIEYIGNQNRQGLLKNNEKTSKKLIIVKVKSTFFVFWSKFMVIFG